MMKTASEQYFDIICKKFIEEFKIKKKSEKVVNNYTIKLNSIVNGQYEVIVLTVEGIIKDGLIEFIEKLSNKLKDLDDKMFIDLVHGVWSEINEQTKQIAWLAR